MIHCLTLVALIFLAAGIYGFMNSTVCTLSPQINKVDVNYSDGDIFSGTIGTKKRENSAISDAIGGPAAVVAAANLRHMVLTSQATDSNVMGDQLYSLIQGAGGEDDILPLLVSRASFKLATLCSEFAGRIHPRGFRVQWICKK